MAQKNIITHPFPGLRAYKASESQFFYGRDREIEDCLNILQQNKVLILTGENGVGKSSLINAGILSKLHKGFSGQAGREWEVCSFRPGIAPIENLCYSLSENGALYMGGKAKTTDHSSYKKTLESKRNLGLAEIYRQAEIFEKKNLLIVIDQLEDLFKYRTFFDAESESDDDLLFNIVHRTSRFKETAIYFILAIDDMYLAKLNNYERFTETLNNTLFNLSAINTDGILSLVKNTFHTRNVQFDLEWIEQLGEYLKEQPSTLPVVQFLFKKIYDQHAITLSKEIILLTQNEIRSFGGYTHAVTQSLTLFYEALENQQKRLFEFLLRGITYGSNEKDQVYYQKIEYLTNLTHISPNVFSDFLKKVKEELGDLIDLFKSQIRGYEVIQQKVLQPDDIVSLKYVAIQQWDYFNRWQKEERQNYSTFLDNNDKAEKYPKESLLTSTSLQTAKNWLNDENVNSDWAQKYPLDFSKTTRYIEKSIKAHTLELQKQEAIKQDIERAKKRSRRLQWIGVGIVILALSVLGYQRHDEANRQRKLYQEMNEKATALDLAIQLKDQKEKDILELRRKDSVMMSERQNEQKLKMELIEGQLLSQNRLITLQMQNEKQSKELEEKRDRIKEDSLKAIMLINDAYKKEKYALNSQEFIDLKDSLSLLLYTLNNTSINDYDRELLGQLTASSISIYDRIKDLGQLLNRNHDDDNLRQIAVDLIAKLNGQYEYSSVAKHNLTIENKKPLLAMNISNQGKIAAGGKSNILYASYKNVAAGIHPLTTITEFKSSINALEFISENLVAVGLENSELWVVELESKEKQKIFPSKKWVPGKIISASAKELYRLSTLFQKEYFKGIGFVEFYKDGNIILVSLENSIVEIDLEKMNSSDSDYSKNIPLQNLVQGEFITSMTLSDSYHSIFIATNKGNVIIFDLQTKEEKKYDNATLKLKNETAIEIEFYNDKILIGTNEGSIFFYQIDTNKSLRLLGSRRANFSKVKDILYDNNQIYSLSKNGIISIIPTAYFSDTVNQSQTPVNIALGEGNFGHAVEAFSVKDVSYFVTADQLGNLVYWDLDLDNNFDEIKRIYANQFSN